MRRRAAPVNKSCNFIVSALASLAVTLAKLTIALRQWGDHQQ
jgi:hypothetical protein